MQLGLSPDSPKVGLGLWHYRYVTLALELIVFAIGVVIYLRAFRPRTSGAKVGGALFFAALFALTLATPFFPDPPDGRAFGIQALVGYLLLAGLAHLVDRKFEPRTY
jgi:hypothetical protein